MQLRQAIVHSFAKTRDMNRTDNNIRPCIGDPFLNPVGSGQQHGNLLEKIQFAITINGESNFFLVTFGTNQQGGTVLIKVCDTVMVTGKMQTVAIIDVNVGSIEFKKSQR